MSFLVNDLEIIVKSLKERNIEEVEFETGQANYITYLGMSPSIVRFYYKDGNMSIFRSEWKDEDEHNIYYREPTFTETKNLKENNV